MVLRATFEDEVNRTVAVMVLLTRVVSFDRSYPRTTHFRQRTWPGMGREWVAWSIGSIMPYGEEGKQQKKEK
jgi:hypothetical protein